MNYHEDLFSNECMQIHKIFRIIKEVSIKHYSFDFWRMILERFAEIAKTFVMKTRLIFSKFVHQTENLSHK